MSTIIAGTDFSPAAFNAVCYAADLAAATNRELLLLNIYTIPITYAEVPMMIDEEVMIQDLEAGLSELKAAILKRTKPLVIKTAVRAGTFFSELNLICKEIEPYMVVLGSQGTTAAERLLMGGHTLYALKHLGWPVLVIPPDAHMAEIRKIALACDFEEVADTVPVNKIQTFARDFHAVLHIFNISKKEEDDPGFIAESGVLHQLMRSAAPHYHYVKNENTDEGVMQSAMENQIDLLIILPKHHHLPEALIHKSHTKYLAMHCKLPLLALKPSLN